MKFWITKHALTKGVYSEEVEPTHSPDVVKRKREFSFYHRPYWHQTEKQANLHAEILVQKKIRTLKSSLAKLEKMQFTTG